MTPIWKDYTVTLGTAAVIEYRIVANADDIDITLGTVIYNGRAYKRPGASSNMARINDVIADYLAEIDNRTSYPMAFAVDVLVGGIWTRKVYEEFSWDWSYDSGFDAAMEDLMSFPILRKLTSRQKLLVSFYSGLEMTFLFRTADGTEIEQIENPTLRTDTDFYNILSHSAPTYVVDIPQGAVSVLVDGREYDIESCGEAVLYYENAYGGWDSLLIEGRVKESAQVQRREMRRDYNNANVQNRGAVNYLNEIQDEFSLVTGWLSDAESSRIMQLMHSTNVFLHLLEDDEIVPVVLTDTVTDKKTYKGEGCRLVNYTITAKVAHEKIRR